VTRLAGLVVGLPLLIGAVVAVPGGWNRGPVQWQLAGIAFALCVPPGVLVVFLADYLSRVSPYGRVLAVFVGTFVRMAVGFGGGVLIFLAAAFDNRADKIAFWLWLLFAYLVTLVVETVVLSGRQSVPLDPRP
jgi:hypothetical protein